MADDGYRGYGSDNGRGRGGSEPPTDPLTELARLIGQSDPFGDPARRADPRAPADWRDAPQQPAQQHYENGGYDDRYAAQHEQSQYPQDSYARDGYAHEGNAQDGNPQDGNPQDGNPQERYAPEGYAQDGYGNDGNGYAASHDAQSYAGDAHHDGAGYPNAHSGYGDNYPAPPQAGYPESNDAPYDQSAYDQQQANGYDRPQANGFVPPPFLGADQHPGREDTYYDDVPAPRRRGWIVTAVALIGLAVLGTAGAFAYRSVFAGGPPPLITRDVRPDKVAPPAQNADNANKQPDRLATNEQMAPPPEQPINIPAAPPAQPAPNMAPAAPTWPGAAPNQTIAPQQPPVAAPAAPTGPGAPRKIHTVKINGPDQEPAVEAPMAPPRPIAPRATAPRAAALPPHNSDGPLSLAPQGANEAPAPTAPRAAAPPMRTTALAPAPSPGENAGGSGYYVQVSAQTSEAEARSSYRNIQANYASLLGGHKPSIRPKGHGFYGAQVGPFSHEGAAHLCEELKTAGGKCFVVKN